jgi:hypothetical protein
MQWIADEIRELGGESYVFRAAVTSPARQREIERLFSAASGSQSRNLLEALRGLEQRLPRTSTLEERNLVEEALRRIHRASLKLRLRSHFPGPEEEVLHKRLRAVRERLDRQHLRRRGRG